MKNIDSSRDELLADAATHLRVALELLDRAAAPGQISARVDHALCEIDEILPFDAALGVVSTIDLGLFSQPN